MQNSEKTEVPFIPEGSYYGVVRTSTNAQDANLDNNVGFSKETVKITVDQLSFNKETTFEIKGNTKMLLKIETDYNIQAFKVILSSTSNNAYHDLFLQLEKIPTENNFIAKSRFIFATNQTLFLKDSKKATYYVLVRSYNAINEQMYNVNILLTEVTDLDVDYLTPQTLSKKGETTFTILGNFIPVILKVKL